jgi:hypothetical protein
MADQVHLGQVAAIDHGDAATPERRIHAVAADHRRAVQGAGVVGGHRVVAQGDVLGFLPRQAPDADDFRLERIAQIERPDHALVPARRIAGQQREVALMVDAETVRAAARHVVKADLPGLARVFDVENVKAATAVFAFVACELLGIHIEKVVADEAQLVTVHALRCAKLGDLVRLARVRHVMDCETFRRVETGAADGADIGVAVLDLDQTAAAKGRGRIVTQQPEIVAFLSEARAHQASLYSCS